MQRKRGASFAVWEKQTAKYKNKKINKSMVGNEAQMENWLIDKTQKSEQRCEEMIYSHLSVIFVIETEATNSVTTKNNNKKAKT